MADYSSTASNETAETLAERAKELFKRSERLREESAEVTRHAENNHTLTDTKPQTKLHD
jgi:hypothetical protein